MALRNGPFQITGKMHEFDLWLHAAPVHGAQKVSRKHERAFQDRHYKQIPEIGFSESFRHGLDPLGDLRLAEQNPDLALVAHYEPVISVFRDAGLADDLSGVEEKPPN